MAEINYSQGKGISLAIQPISREGHSIVNHSQSAVNGQSCSKECGQQSKRTQQPRELLQNGTYGQGFV